jgi:hypothetical protein
MNNKIIPYLTGWLVFAIALVAYISTLEPSVSFWDCGEFISCAYNLEIGHAPGAPIFMLLGRFFGLFAGGDASKVAWMVNMASGLASAFTIFFLFWTLVWFAKKWISKSGLNYSETTKQLAIYGSAAIGALSFAFTDSFWFSAVEGEVYATSSLFSAIAFWAITKWEESVDTKENKNWIVFIFYILGISVGIHLLNTLTIPAIALVYYYKKFKPSVKGILITLSLSSLLILLLIFVIIPGVVTLAAYFDLFFVNSLGLPVYIGASTFIACLIAVIYLLYEFAIHKQKAVLKLVVLSFSFWLIGYSAFTLLIIRSASNPFIDMNNVENLFGLVNYLNREQYPQRPLIYGNNYNSPIVDVKERYTYKLYNNQYLKDKLNPDYVFDNRTLTLFPRMASMDPGHENAYKSWVNIKGRPVEVEKRDGTPDTIMVPTFTENFAFFMKYQLGFMYFRYFMWNFSGRQNDTQGHGGVVNGNWITGIPFMDKVLVGPQDDSFETIDQKKSRCVYFLLPLLLGLIGLMFHYKIDKHNFFVNLMFFFLTGIAIAIYLNEIPVTPRERDYVYVGSFYAFSIWIGLGCLGIIESIAALRKNTVLCSSVVAILLLSVPGWMLYQNYSCHDRSNRYTTRDYASDVLESCDKDALLFTTADNDTYPIWYSQEVEGVRKDIREILEPFMPLDWYAEQFNQSFDGKKDLKFSYRGNELLMDENLYFPIISRIDSAIDLNDIMEFLKSKDPRTTIEANDNNRYHFLPGNKLSIKVNKANFIKTCSYAKVQDSIIPDAIQFQLKKQALNRDELFVLDLIAKNNWERPIYFISTSYPEQLGLSEYVYPEGLLYRLSPFKGGLPKEFAHAQALYQYNLLKNKFKYGNVNSGKVYLDQMNVQMVSMLHFREVFAQVAKMLALSNEKEKAVEILKLVDTIFTKDRIPYFYDMPNIVEAWYVVGDNEKADQLALDIANYFDKKLTYFAMLNKHFKENATSSETGTGLYILQQLAQTTETYKSPLKDKIMAIFTKYYHE